MNDENNRSNLGNGQPPSSSREWQLIEKLLGAAQDEQRKARRWNIAFRIIGFSYLFILLFMFIGRDTGATTGMAVDHVGLVEVAGEIAADTDASADNIVGGLRDAFEADKTKAVVLRIDSPGGSPVQAGIIYDEIRRLRAEYPDKKLYAVIADIGASGAYYIAAAADDIYVDKASIVGSIGVIMQGFGAQELIRKLGIESRTMTAGSNKNMLDPFSPVDPQQKQYVQAMLNTIHAQFIAAVKEGRGDRLKVDGHPELFSGLFWTGEQAVQLGLADGLGTVSSVARDVVGTDEIVDYSYQRSPMERFIERFGASVGAGVASALRVNASEPLLR